MPKSPSLIVFSCLRHAFRKDRAKCRASRAAAAIHRQGGNSLPIGGKVRPPAETREIAPFFASEEKEA